MHVILEQRLLATVRSDFLLGDLFLLYFVNNVFSSFTSCHIRSGENPLCVALLTIGCKDKILAPTEGKSVDQNICVLAPDITSG